MYLIHILNIFNIVFELFLKKNSTILTKIDTCKYNIYIYTYIYYISTSIFCG